MGATLVTHQGDQKIGMCRPMVTRDDRTLSGLPPTTTHDLREISHGAVLIGPFEGSRWRGGCGESYGISMGASPSRGGLAAEQASVEKRRFVEVA